MIPQEFYPYVRLIALIATSILAVVLTYSARNLIGKGWLVASVIITLVRAPGYQIISLIAQHSEMSHGQIGSWQGVLDFFGLIGTACFGFFLFSNWIISRMKLDVKNLLFSFSGRIPRSAFWISVCILYPIWSLLWFVTSSTNWLGYTIFLIPSMWIALAVYTKRWHDCAKSGWMSMVLFIPVIGLFWFFGFLGFVKGTHGRNQYGDDPLDTDGTDPNSAKKHHQDEGGRPVSTQAFPKASQEKKSSGLLPKEVKCPSCGEQLELDEKERIDRMFTCSECGTTTQL